MFNALNDRETLKGSKTSILDNEGYQRHREELVNLFMGLKEKDKIKIEDLTLYEPIFTSTIQKSKNVLFVKNLLIFIVLTVAMIIICLVMC